MVRISDKIYINIDILGRHITDFCESFTYRNPLYYKQKMMGFSTAKISKVITNYTWHSDGGKKYLVIPRGSLSKLKSFMILKGIPPIRVTDNRIVHESLIDFSMSESITFSYNQKRVIETLLAHEGGLIQVPPGGGKTISMMGLIEQVKQPTLIVVHTTKLQEQWIDEFKEKTTGTYKLGRLGGKKKASDGDVVVAVVDSLYTKCFGDDGLFNYDYLNKFGMVVFDECLDPDTMISVPEGLKRLKDVNIGDEVCTPGGGIAKVKNKWVTRKESHKYSCVGGNSVIASENHLVPTITSEGPLKTVPIGEAKYLILPNGECEYIRSVTPAGERDLIDIELDNEEKLFIANGFVVHNCHHCPARSFKDILDNAACKYKVGVTGTATRKDGMHMLLFDSLGEIALDIPESEFKDRITDFEYRMISTNVHMDIPNRIAYMGKGQKVSNMDFNKFIDLIIRSEERNKLIVSNVSEDIEKGHKVIVLTHRIEHAKALFAMLSEKYEGHLIIGDNSKDVDLNEIKKTNTFQFLVANREIASEGLDIPQLSALHLVIPSNNFQKLKQQLGRIRRICSGKLMPLVTDYADNFAFVLTEENGVVEKTPIFFYAAKKRLAFYQKLRKDYHM